MLNKVSSSGINYNLISDKVIEPNRYIREKDYKSKDVNINNNNAMKSNNVSATFDAFRRLTTSQESRKISDLIADPNRITWEQYKKDNEDKLDLNGIDQKKMIEYRKQLDENRDKLLKQKNIGKSAAISDSEENNESESSDNNSSTSSENSKNKIKNHLKHKKDKKRKHKSHKSHKHHKKKK